MKHIFDIFIISAKSHSRCALKSEKFVNCVCVWVCVCFTSFIISRGGDRSRALSFEYKTETADSTDRMSFLTSNLTDEISPNSDALS